MMFISFFSKVQNTDWYSDFLSPVVREINKGATVFDIGTGPARLLIRLREEKAAQCIGVDTSVSMIARAKKNVKEKDIQLIHIQKGKPYPFDDNSFDFVCLCNVLFLLSENVAEFILSEALRLTKPGGKILVLTPTGEKMPRKMGYNGVFNDFSLQFWHSSTKIAGKKWQLKGYLAEYCKKNKLDYVHQLVFHSLASIEIIQC
jgi:ubiquinone/menaquinone biosynthesis C-methylase UbiE